jgi:hypothetical protein
MSITGMGLTVMRGCPSHPSIRHLTTPTTTARTGTPMA